MPTPQFQPYVPGINETADGKIKGLMNSYVDMSQYMQWILSHLDEKNVVRAKAVVADWVYAGAVKTDQLIAGDAKIGTALIETLTVGGNVVMGPNATISWNKVTGAPSIPTNTDITQITANYIATPNLITNIAQVNNELTLGTGYEDSSAIIFAGQASISTEDDVMTFSAMSGIHFAGYNTSGLENSGYATQDWVNDNFVAK